MNAQTVGRNSERFRQRASQATAFGGTALRSALRITLNLAFSALLVMLSQIVAAAPTIRLETTSEADDFIGGGRPRLYTEKTGVLFVNTTDRSTPGQVDFAEFFLQPVGPEYNKWFLLMVGTRQLGHELEIGRYVDAERASFATAGHPGLDVSDDGVGCNTISGIFEISDVSISPDKVLQRLDMTFEQRCENATGLLRGRFAYDASGAPISFATVPVVVPGLSAAATLLVSLMLAALGIKAIACVSNARRNPKKRR